jgi:dihydroorotase
MPERYDLEIVNGNIITSQGTFKGSIAIKDGKIKAISEEPIGYSDRIINATGLYVLPGMIDEHVHCMDPGETEREDFPHCTKAAAVAGVTTIIEHTHSNPVRKVEDLIKKREYLSKRSLVDFGLAAHVWPEYLEELKPLWNSGISFFKVFTLTTHGIPGLSNDELLNVFSRISSFDGRILVHCEDSSIISGNERRLKITNNIADYMQMWRSKEAERVAVGSACLIAYLTKAHITIAHVSHPEVIKIVDAFRNLGANINVETCPQYLFLNYEKLKELGKLGKFTPPARSHEDNKGLIEMINKGKVDIIASDHAPSTKEQKLKGDLKEIPFGIPGIQTTFYLMLTLVKKGLITMERLVKLYSENPARILGLYPRKGSISLGSDADLVLVDLNKEWIVSDEKIISKAGWSPYSGEKVFGKVIYTLLRGKIIVENEEVVAEPGIGRFVSRD